MALTELFYSELVAAVGSLVGGRVYINPIPPGSATPVVAYKRVYGAHTRRHTAAGSSNGVASQWQTRWQIDVLSKSYADIETVMSAVADYFGSMSDYTSAPLIYDSVVDMAFTVWDGTAEMHRGIMNVSMLSSSS